MILKQVNKKEKIDNTKQKTFHILGAPILSSPTIFEFSNWVIFVINQLIYVLFQWNVGYCLLNNDWYDFIFTFVDILTE